MDNSQKGNKGFLKGTGKKNQPGDSRFMDRAMQVDEIMAVLDLDVEIQDGIIEKVMQKKETVKIDKPSGFDFSKLLQIAAVLVGGIFLGILLGKNADINSFHKKQSREKQALIQLREKHHLSEDYTFGRF